eukprot:182351_1
MKEDSNEDEEPFIVVETPDGNEEDSGPNPPISGGPRLGRLPPLGEPRRRRKCCGGDEKERQDVSVELKAKGIRMAPLILLVVLFGPMLLPGIIWAWNNVSNTELGVKLGMRMDHRTRLVKFYKEHSPEKITQVDRILGKYKGREAQLFSKLEATYKRREAIKKEEEEFRRYEEGNFSD